MKQMKMRLKLASESRQQVLDACADKIAAFARDADAPAAGVEAGALEQELAMLKQQVQTLESFYYWLDEPRLHASELYLPALPPEYDAMRLRQVLEGDRTPWRHLLDCGAIEDDVMTLRRKWIEAIEPRAASGADACVSGAPAARDDARTRVEARLKRDDDVTREPAPQVIDAKPCVPEVGEATFYDAQALQHALRSDFATLVDSAREYHTHVSRHVALDSDYVDMLPRLWSNRSTSVTLSVPCKAIINPLHKCRGPAALSTIYEGAREDSVTSRRVDENRAATSQLLIEALLPPAQAVCAAAVHVDRAVTRLLRLRAEASSAAQRKALQEVGVELFYHVTTFMDSDTKFYPPTQQFFTGCTETLGREFIRGNPAQAQPLMQAILQTPHLLGVLSPNFAPNNSPDLFVCMYRDALPVARQHGPDVAFTLLSKFDVTAWLCAAHAPAARPSGDAAETGAQRTQRRADNHAHHSDQRIREPDDGLR